MKNFIILLTLLLIIGCAGEDKENKDNNPPKKPNFYKHLGDLGDVHSITSLPLEGYDGNDINDFNNGIDALHGPENNIKLQWEHLVDNDLSAINLFRYSFFDEEPELIANLNPSIDEYIDRDLITYRQFYYYMEVSDKAGNKTISDTISYKLYNKAQLASPISDMTINDLHNLNFTWLEAGMSETIDFYRVILYRDNSNDNYSEYETIWSYDEYVTEHSEFTINYSDNSGDIHIPNGPYFWRVDAFRYNSESDIYFGSESIENRLYIYQ